MRFAVSAIVLLSLLTSVAIAQPRDRRLMDFGWKFRLADSTLPGEGGTAVSGWKWQAVEGKPAASPPAVDGGWKEVAPPQDVFVGRVGFAWYSVSLPNLNAGKGVGRTILFDAVDDNATVFLNGKKIGTHEGWSESFELPLDAAWNEAGENVLAVLVENTAGMGGMKGATLKLATTALAAEDFDDHAWRTVDVPHDFVIEQPVSPANGDPNFGFHAGHVGWYRKRFTVDAEKKGQRVWLEFDGVYRDAKIFLNGKPLGSHPSGYTSFYLDATDAVRFGRENTLAVRVDGTSHEGWWYEGGGIYRHIYLTTLAPLHVAHWGTFVTTNVTGPLPAETADSAVSVKTTISNQTGTGADFTLTSDIVDSDDKTVATTSTVCPATQTEVAQSLPLPAAHLWSPDRPYLYHVVTTLRQADKEVDRYVTPLGVRHLRFDADHGFFLNGSPLKIKGTCNHQDFAGVGIALPDRIHEYKIEKLKEMGSNAYRCSHHQYAEELLDACDRIGMLVMDENRHLGESERTLDEAASLVLRDRNHPSVILWSVCNEEAQQGTEEGRRKAQAIKDVFNKYDGTRLVTAAMQASWGSGISNVIDVQGFNYFPEQYDPYHKSHPQQPLIGSETGSILTTRGEYKQDDIRGFMSSYNDGAERAWLPIAEREFMAGAFVWTGFDYRGEPTPFGWPNVNSHFGIMDLCGFPKDDYYYYQANWTEQPVLHLFPHWNYAYPPRPEAEQGAMVEVRCYSNCDQVELFVNGKSQGVKPGNRTGHLTWKVKWNPGSISAKGAKAGKEITAKIETAGLPAKIQLTADRTVPNATGEDVVLLSAQLLDDAGRPIPTADNPITYAVTQGDAKILGTGNGNPSDPTPDHSPTRASFNGRSLAVVHLGTHPGPITITASSPNLPPTMVQINLQPATPRPRVP